MVSVWDTEGAGGWTLCLPRRKGLEKPDKSKISSLNLEICSLKQSPYPLFSTAALDLTPRTPARQSLLFGKGLCIEGRPLHPLPVGRSSLTQSVHNDSPRVTPAVLTGMNNEAGPSPKRKSVVSSWGTQWGKPLMKPVSWDFPLLPVLLCWDSNPGKHWLHSYVCQRALNPGA